jgi:PEP-CTERM motif
MNARLILGLTLVSLASSTALAGFQQVPEPGILELLAIGAVAGVAIAIRKRRK